MNLSPLACMAEEGTEAHRARCQINFAAVCRVVEASDGFMGDIRVNHSCTLAVTAANTCSAASIF